MIELALVSAYIIIGIGYGKTFVALNKEESDTVSCFCFSAFLWPIFLLIASFWNFKNERN